MGISPKFGKKIKIEACKKYHNGRGSFESISKEIGCNASVLRRWYYTYIQYTSSIFKRKLQKTGMTQSMSRVGKCIDNGPMEGFFGTLKSEIFYGKNFKSMEELIQKIKNYIHFYNEQRFQKNLGCLTPIEYRNKASNCA